MREMENPGGAEEAITWAGERAPEASGHVPRGTSTSPRLLDQALEALAKRMNEEARKLENTKKSYHS